MYNRYIPQPDGSYRKNRISEPSQPNPPEPECHDAPPPPPHDRSAEGPAYTPSHRPSQTAGDFLRRLLPKDLDTGDLLVILLLLLMAGDKKENNASALLTLALYLFM